MYVYCIFQEKDKMDEFDIVCCGNCIGNLTGESKKVSQI